MRTKTKILAATATALAIAGAAATVSVATSSDDRPLEGGDLERATSVALAHTGEGTVVEAEVGDGGAAYEVEVRLEDGSVVKVELDDGFQVTGSSADDDAGGSDQDGATDD